MRIKTCFAIMMTLISLGVSTAFADWKQMPGAATDIAVGGGNIWVVGTNRVDGGFGVYQWTDSGFRPVNGGAVAISVDGSGRPWVVNNRGDIFSRAGNWRQWSGSAKDIAANGNHIFVVGTTPVAGGYQIYRWNGDGWDTVHGGAVRIAVDPSGNPWVVNASNEIYHYNNGSWERLPGSAKDIAVGRDGSVWVIGTDAAPGGFGIHRWNGNGWDKVDGGGVRIAVDGSGRPWVVNSSGSIFRFL